jgi:hypothetical protein
LENEKRKDLFFLTKCAVVLSEIRLDGGFVWLICFVRVLEVASFEFFGFLGPPFSGEAHLVRKNKSFRFS